MSLNLSHSSGASAEAERHPDSLVASRADTKRIGWLGFHREGLAALGAAIDAGYPISAVISLKPEAAERLSSGVDYEPLCTQYGIPIYRIRNINDEEALALLDWLDLDVLIVLGWGQILREPALARLKIGAVGAHASLLPHNRGGAPVNWAIIHGERKTGNTLIRLSPQLDAGDILAQREIDITPFDTCGSIYEQVAATNREMVLEILPALLEGRLTARPQTELDEPSLARRRPEDGRLDWCRSSQAVYDFVRALTRPYPGAYSSLSGKKWKLWQAAALPSEMQSAAMPGGIAGTLLSPDPAACGWVVQCKPGAIVLLEVEDEEGRCYSGRELLDLPWQGANWA